MAPPLSSTLEAIKLSDSESAYAYFRVAGEDLPLEEITSSLATQPTESWRKGDPGKYNPSRPDSGWCLYSPLTRSTLRIDEHIEALLPLLEHRTSVVRELSERYKTYLVCVGYYYESSPGFFLSKEVIARIENLGLSLDLDLYCNWGGVDGL